jgi:peptide/nickel transport system ATP-binding protein
MWGDMTTPETLVPLLSVRGLGKTFSVRQGLRAREVRALTDVSFDVHRGEVVALVGESGSGKSTTARLILRLAPASQGEILFEEQDLLRRRGATRRLSAHIQMIFQDPFGSLNPMHTVAYHLERPLVRHGKAARRADLERRVGELLETVGLVPSADVARRYPHELSGGQRQRVAIARALAVDPKLILADEPTSMLDVSIRIGILNLLCKLKEERGISLLFITHDLASARYVADRTMVMYAGLIVESGPSHVVMDEPLHPYTRLLLSAVPAPTGTVKAPLAEKSGAVQQMNGSSGCPFANRCPEVFDRCRSEMPALRSILSHRQVRCHLYGEQDPTPVDPLVSA